MAIGDGTVWNEALPDNSTLAHQIDDYNRDVRVGVRARMAREHIWTSSQTATNEGGHHQFITFQQSTAAPSLSTAITQVGALYCGSSGDGYPLVFENSAGTTYTLVSTVGDAIRTIYPVGSIYISTLSTNPVTLLGFGTWAAFGAGKVLVGIDGTDADFDTAEETGGEKTHVLTSTEMPAHTHTVGYGYTGGAVPNGGNEGSTAAAITSSSTGGDGAHNNVQPYIVVYMWKRTA